MNMKTGIINNSPLYGKDLAPVPVTERTWTKWNLAALWVGMAVCIPTYILASYMIRAGLSWTAALGIIFLANIVITLPMVLNGHAGVKFGIPFPVIGRAAYGIYGIHIPSLLRGFVACGWFGIQTWIGGLAIYSIGHALLGSVPENDLNTGKFICFGIFWLINIYFIWKGTESIRWLEDFSAPILIGIGLVLIVWGYSAGDGFMKVLNQSETLGKPSILLQDDFNLSIHAFATETSAPRAQEFKIFYPGDAHPETETEWMPLVQQDMKIPLGEYPGILTDEVKKGELPIYVQVRSMLGEKQIVSSKVKAVPEGDNGPGFWTYILWFTSMVGFWATMSLSISDITRFAKSQKDQIAGQFIGLPGTMLFYSFVGIFVTCAAVLAFQDILLAEDAPWDPVSLMNHFEHPAIIIFAQLAMLIATLSTNIAANVIAPANAIANIFPRSLSFRSGGVWAGVMGILLCPWWLMDDISSILIFISGLLGPVLAVLLCDYFLIRKKELNVEALYAENGVYRYSGGFNISAMIATLAGALFAVAGKWIPALEWAFSLSWFSGFALAFVLYYILYPLQMGSGKVKQE